MEVVNKENDYVKLNQTELDNLIRGSKQITPMHTFKDHEYGIVDFSQSKKVPSQVATVSFDKSIKIYDIEKLVMMKSLVEHTKGVWTIDYSNNKNTFITGGNDNQIIFWDANTYKPISKNTFHCDTVYDVKFSANDKYLATCSKGMICIWDTSNFKKPLHTIKGIHE